MFLQIKLPECDTHLDRYLWRDLEINKEPTIFRLLRVTFGDKSSPDTAGFIMKKIANEQRTVLPEASVILDRDRYVDDIIHSCASPESAMERIKQVDTALSTGSFQIKEWFVSSPEVQQQLKPGGNSPGPNGINLDRQEDVKTLGLEWDPEQDQLKFIAKSLQVQKYTKRQIVSKMSMLYDPLGLASCITIKARISMQDIWKAKQYGWDDILPHDTCQLWKQLLAEIKELKLVQFPRCLKPSNAQGKSKLHMFCDASSSAYGAIAYLLWPTSNEPEVNIASAKARVAPLRQTTTPLSPHQGGFYERLIRQVKQSLQVAIGHQTLTWGEMSTVFAEIKSLINSRPIGFSADSPDDLRPLTPNHFILGRATTAVPNGPFEETKNLRKRFLFVQALVQQFWNRFIKEYIPTLIKRSKWQQVSRQIQVGDIVLLTDINLHRGKWNLARIEEVYPGSDGVIRNVKVTTQHGEYKRSIQRICPILESGLDS